MGSRADLEKIVGATNVDERPVRDLWPVHIMEERAGNARERVVVARPANRAQLSELLRWATAEAVAVTPMGGATGMCGALSPESGEVVVDMGAFDRVLEVDETNLLVRCEAGVNG
ncbi:MAG TPA: FAD-binding protein, partial [Candidatus Dormibacteraeota bacterium]|nr:FAD-binding protein [Candidatus Dormibacteraeota bacterium]